ncbi:DUF3304 domain-containing protein [Pseudomonas solani]|uniref:DUF3304 domain-containing protein n=1 Tax=Pseudomonas solani TaxID=2731552 RepID=UPI003F4AC77C
MKRVLHVLVGLFCFALVGCSGASNEMAAGNIAAVNHVEGTAINWFSVNGYRASGGGGRQCCIVLPIRWRPGLILNIEWEVDSDPYAYSSWPPLGTDGYLAEQAKHAANYKRYRTTAEVPEWPGTDSCGLKVHFLPCNQVKVTTSCWGYGSPNNPIKEPRNMKEPAVCPG